MPVDRRLFGILLRTLPLLVILPATSCADRESGPAVLTADDLPLHLEEHLDAATIEGSEVPADLPAVIEWRFDEAQPAWTSLADHNLKIEPLELQQTEGALRLTLSEANRSPRDDWFSGDIYVDLPDLRRSQWSHILVRARTSDEVRRIRVAFNLRAQTDTVERRERWRSWGEDAVVIRDGATHTYRLRADWSAPWSEEHEDLWRQLGLVISAGEPSSIDILSVTIVPKAALYAVAPVGVRTEVRDEAHRRTLYTHAPGRLSYRVQVPEGGRLDLGLGVLTDDPVTFRIAVETDGGEAETLLEETYADPERWAQRSVDLSHRAGESVTLVLEATSDEPGTVVLWAAPTLSGARTTDKPNIIFYVIDGAGADLMSVYGYNRRTTPNLERIAAEGAVFERARSNSAWTKPSTASFMTSLHHSVLGGFRSPQDRIPEQAVTMAQRFHRAGYQTGVFTSNPHAGSLSGLQRGVDVFRDKGIEKHSASSVELHDDFWRWREEYPGEPFWVHFQTTDVHEPHHPVAPFAGLYISPARRASFYDWLDRMWDFEGWMGEDEAPETVLGFYRWRLEQIGVDPLRFFDTQRGLYDETMAHQDYQLGRLVERLKATGEWENTLLIIASDHGHPAGTFSRFGRGLIDPPPPEWEGALFDSYRTRIPLIFVWPGHIAPGQRFREPVSMIDMLPTVLDLAGLPMPEVMQGQSLAPLLLGREGWEPQPVIIEQLQNDLDTGEFTGHIEVIDGRWGASLEIFPERADGEPEVEPAGFWRAARPHRPDVPRLLLYDLLNDPFTLHNVNEQYPDLVEKYTAFLEAQWEAHQALAQQFTPGDDVALTPEQLRTLRSLGYIQ